MKRHLPLVFCLLITAVLLYEHFVLGGKQKARIAELEAELATLRQNPRALPREPAANPLSRGKLAADPSGSASPAPAETASVPAMKEEERDALDVLLGAGAREVAARTDARLKLLRDRLKLRPNQEEALQKLGAAHNEAVLAAFERIRQKSATPPDMGILMDWSLGGTPLDLSSLLDAGQADLYRDFSVQEQAGRVEGMVNMELLELQSQGSLQLTPEQKDQVFAALTGIVAEEDAMGAAYYLDDGNFMERIDASLQRRREALQAVLDASQMQSYNRMLDEDRGLIVGMFPGGQ